MTKIPGPPAPASEARVVEEYDGNEGTNVEAEDTDSEELQPWDPEKIRVSTKNFSLRNILDMLDDGHLELAPDFQRNRVWKEQQKSRLIESILLQIPLPAFYFAEDADGMMRVVDGLQRLSTVREFVRPINKAAALRLTALEYLELSGMRFEDIEAVHQRRIHNTQIVAHVIDPTTPNPVKYDIFKRINTGGTPLNAQEVRHCMSAQRSRDFLKRCAAAPEFDTATGGVLRDHPRMIDREVALRFAAFYMLGGDANRYRGEFGSMEVLLDWATLEIDTRLNSGQLEEIHSAFKSAMNNASTVFGAHAFRKWPWGIDRLLPINRPLFESWASVLWPIPANKAKSYAAELRTLARDAMTYDAEYVDSITSSTGDPRRVERRFTTAKNIVSEAIK